MRFRACEDGGPNESSLRRRRTKTIANRRSFLKSAAAAGLTGAAILGISSVLPLRTFAAGGAPTGTLTFGNAEPPTANSLGSGRWFWSRGRAGRFARPRHAYRLGREREDGSLGRDGLEGGPSPTTVALTIRTDIKFHDGSPLTAEDIKASIDRLGMGSFAQSMVATPGIAVNIVSPGSIEVVSPTAFSAWSLMPWPLLRSYPRRILTTLTTSRREQCTRPLQVRRLR